MSVVLGGLLSSREQVSLHSVDRLWKVGCTTCERKPWEFLFDSEND
jgi:hypothetical protein